MSERSYSQDSLALLVCDTNYKDSLRKDIDFVMAAKPAAAELLQIEQLKQLISDDGTVENEEIPNSNFMREGGCSQEGTEADVNNNYIKSLESCKSTEYVKTKDSSINILQSSQVKITEIWHCEEEVVKKNSQTSSVGSLDDTWKCSKKKKILLENLEGQQKDNDSKGNQSEINLILRTDSLNEFKDFEINNCSSQDQGQDSLFSNSMIDIQSFEQNETYQPYEPLENSCDDYNRRLLDDREYYYVSSGESDIEVLIKIPKMSLADSCLEELSNVCPFTIKAIGIPEQRNKNENLFKPDATFIPKPYTNIFKCENKDDASGQLSKNSDIKDKFHDEQTKSEGHVTGNGNDKDSTDLNNNKVDQQSLTTNEEDLKNNVSSNFSSFHQKFDPSKIQKTKRSASTLTDNLFWKAFVDDTTTSIDPTETRVEKFSTFPNTDSTKASDSQLDVIGVELDTIAKSPLSTLSSVSSWRTFTLSSGYSSQRLHVVGNVQVEEEPIFTPVFEKLEKIGARSEQLKKHKKTELCTSDTSISSASEMPKSKGKNSRRHAKLKSDMKNHSKFNKDFKDSMPTEGVVTDVEKLKVLSFDSETKTKGYSNSSSSCFSLPDEVNSDNNYETNENVKEGVFPFIKKESLDAQLGFEKEIPSNFHFGGDDGDMFESDGFEFDEKVQQQNVLERTPSSIKSSNGSVYSVGASLPPIPSTIRSQKSIISSHSRSPRIGRLALQGKGLVLNKVKPSSTVHVACRRGCESTIYLPTTFRPKCKFHDCDSIHGFFSTTEDLNANTKYEDSEADDLKEATSIIAEKSNEPTSLKKQNRSLSENQQREPRRQNSTGVRRWVTSIFRWCATGNKEIQKMKPN